MTRFCKTGASNILMIWSPGKKIIKLAPLFMCTDGHSMIHNFTVCLIKKSDKI